MIALDTETRCLAGCSVYFIRGNQYVETYNKPRQELPNFQGPCITGEPSYPPRGRSWCTRGCKNSPPTQISHRFLALFFQSQSTLFLLSTQPCLQILGPRTERTPLRSIEAILNRRRLKNLGFSTRFACMAVSERLQRLNTSHGVLQKIGLNNARNLAPLLFEELALYLKS